MSPFRVLFSCALIGLFSMLGASALAYNASESQALLIGGFEGSRERITLQRPLQYPHEVEPIPLQPPRRWTYHDVDLLSRMVWGEGRGVSRNEQKLIVWTALNRVDHRNYPNTIAGVVWARGQFVGYSSRHPVTVAIRQMTMEVLEAWDRGEQAKVYPPFARTPNYLYFHGDGRHNWFRETFRR